MFDTLFKIAVEASVLAGEGIMKIYNNNSFTIHEKSDKSPVTDADFISHKIICNLLEETQIKVLSEEGNVAEWAKIRKNNRYWLIDPLDGTKEFIKRNGEFTVNIALMEDAQPLLGIVYIPDKKKLYAGKKGVGAWVWNLIEPGKLPSWNEMALKGQPLPLKRKHEGYLILGSKSFRSEATDRFMSKLEAIVPDIQIVRAGSSIKFCMIASGEADLYPRLDKIMQWDVAAGHAIVEAAGGVVMQWPDGEEIKYTQPDMRFTQFMAVPKGRDYDFLFNEE